MLDFLKDYNKFHVYDRARYVEYTLKTFDPITPMATFMEAVMKVAYSECFGISDKRTLKGVTLNDMFSDQALISYIKREYSISDDVVDCLDNQIRRKSNFYKHDVDPYAYSDAAKKACFRSVYALASGYYKSQSGKKAPRWDDKAYDELLESTFDESARKTLETEVGPEVEELNKQVAQLKKEKTSANKQIEELTAELNKAKLDKADETEIRRLRVKIAGLEKQIDDADGQSILLKEEARSAVQEKNKAEKELQRLRNIYSAAAEEQSLEAKEKIAAIERDLKAAQLKADELSKKNESLNASVKKLMVEKQRADRKINELGSLTSDSAAITRIERKLLEVQASKEEILEQLQIKEKRIEEIEKLYKSKQSELEKLYEIYQLKQDNSLKEDQLLELYGPKCKLCGSTLKLKSKGSDYFFGCPNHRMDGSGCKSGTVRIWGYESLVRNIVDLRKSSGRPEKFALTPNQLGKYKPAELYFRPYPDSLDKVSPPTYLFQSITVPKEVFKERRKNRIDLFSKFFVTTNLPKQDLQEQDSNKTLYSLALRLLNRGVVLPEYQETEEALREKFNHNDLGAINWLFDSAKYSSPFFPYDSTREKEFAEHYFPRLIGDNWATFVFAQAGFDVLVPGSENSFQGQRVDFFINKNGRKVVVELDGPEHEITKETDRYRDRFLEEHGFIVRRYRNTDVDDRSEAIFEDLKEALGTTRNTRIDADVDNKYLGASKLCHQIAVAIVKCLEKGYIAPTANLRAEASTDLFSQSEIEYILKVAAAEVYSILRNYAIIYGCDTDWQFFDTHFPEIWISIGDGNIDRRKGILIRDCTLPSNILCEIDQFSEELLPKNADEEALSFFLKYIFGFKDGFREGQYVAIKRLLERKDTIVLLPTGSGKSVIYQLSSFIVPGLVVVVSPLVSLIEDQVLNLERKNGINSAVSFTSARTQEEREQKEKSRRLMQHNSTTLVYLAPERLIIPSFRDDARNVLQHNSVYAVAIDEAHCVSEWGHDFRPAYLYVGNASRQMFTKNGVAPVISALTGTASDAVLNDVRLDLGIRGRDALIQPDTFGRKELHFSVKTCEASAKDYNIANLIKNELPARFDTDLESFSKLQGEASYSGIVFTPFAGKAQSQYSAAEIRGELEKMLPEFGVADYYSTAPKDYDEATWKTTIRENARKFKDDEINILVATKAFGMGIDKPNIRYIIHDGLPSSFEQYYQEAGRAGRGPDIDKAECVLLFSNDNEEENEKLLNPELTLKELKEAYAQYDKAMRLSKTEDDVSSLLYFHNQSFRGVEKEVSVVDAILDMLNNAGFEENKTITLFMAADDVESTERDAKQAKRNKNDQEKEWLQALVRLVVLGIVKDYTYDYKRNFRITCGKLDKKYVSERYADYVSGNVEDKNRIIREKRLIQDIKATGIEFAKQAVLVLVNYVYDNIEQSRRRAIREMFDAVKQASEKTGEEQNEYLKERIIQYFTYKGENRDALKSIESGESGGLFAALSLFDFSSEKESYSEDEQQQARDIYVLAGRVLESRPDHPGLLLAQALGRMVSGDINERVIVNNINASIRYAKERYLVDNEKMNEVYYPTFNEILSISPKMFDEICSVYSAQRKARESKVLAEMIQSEIFCDENRDYLLAMYAHSLINEFRGN